MNIIEKFEETKKIVGKADRHLNSLIKELKELQKSSQEKLEQALESSRISQFNEEELKNFLKEPYVILPTKRPNEWWVVVPKFIQMQVGWLERSTESYNIFKVNKFINWLGDIPELLKDKFKFKPELPVKVYDGMVLTGKRYQEETWNRYKRFFSRREGEDRIRVKRGAEFRLIAQMIDDGTLPFLPKEVDKEDLRKANVGFELRDYQEEARQKFLKYGAIGVYWAFSAGKTYLGLQLCSELKGKKLVVVPTITLREQWQKRLKELTDVSDEVEVITYRSFHKVRNKEYVLAIYDECLTGDTKIVLSDGTIKNIKEIKNKDEVIGGSVSDKFSRYASSIYEIRTSSGWLKTTPTHPNLVVEKSSFRRDKHKDQYKPIREKDIGITKSRDLRVGNYLITPKRIPHKTIYHWTPEQLGFIGLIMADGHVDRNSNMIRASVSKDKDWFRKTFSEGARSFGLSYKESINKRGDLNLWVISKELKDLFINVFKVPTGKKSDKIIVSNAIFNSSKQAIRKFLDVYICCDGWVTNKRIFIATISKIFAEDLVLLLKKFGVYAKISIKERPNQKHNTCYQVNFRELPFKISMIRKQEKIEKFNRREFERTVIYKGIECVLTKINEIKILKSEGQVYDFSTDRECFIANSILTHNCHHLPANTFSRLSTIRAKYRLGLSATPYREDGRTDYIFALTGFPVGLDWETLIKLGVIKKPDIRLYILKDRRAKVEKLEEILVDKKKTIIFCDSIKFGNALSKRFEIPFVSGESKKRLEVIEDVETCIVSRVGDEGLSIGDIERIIEIDFLFGSRRQEGQRMGRLFHGQKKGEHVILMSQREFENYSKRLYSIYEKGFRIQIIR